MLERTQKGSTTYAVYSLDDATAVVDQTSINMINNNQTVDVGLSSINIESMNGQTRRLLFDITGKLSVSEYISGVISQNLFKTMLVNLADAIMNFEEYMIDVHQVLLDIDSVFINPIDSSVSFLCIALKDQQQDNDLFLFFKSVVENSQVETVVIEKDYFHVAWNMTRSEKGFSLNNLKSVLTENTLQNHQCDLQPTNNNINYIHDGKPASQSYAEPNLITVKKEEPIQEHESLPEYSTDFMNEEQNSVNHTNDKKKGILGKLPIFSSKKGTTAKTEKKEDTRFQGGLSALSKGKYKRVPGDENVDNGKKISDNMSQQPIYNSTPIYGKGTMHGDHVSSVNLSVQHATVNAPNDFSIGNNHSNVPCSGVSGYANRQIGVQQFNSNSSDNQISGTTVLNSEVENVSNKPLLTTTLENKDSCVRNPSTSCSDNSVAGTNTTVETTMFNSQKSVDSDIHSFPTAINKPIIINKDISTANAVRPNIIPTTVLGNDTSPKTTVLERRPLQTAYLLRTKNREKVIINKPIIHIGRDRNDLDYCINDNTNISHVHANIIMRGSQYYVIDLNSSNHTYVNGHSIPNSVEIKLNNGDKVYFADEEFQFIIG